VTSTTDVAVRRRPSHPDDRARRWDGHVVLYDGSSGDTHILDPLAGEVLARIGAAPVTAHDIAGRLAADLGVSPDSVPTLGVRRAFEHFARLGLTEEPAA
jgi:PqqD family protein of HPr-rel-A system